MGFFSNLFGKKEKPTVQIGQKTKFERLHDQFGALQEDYSASQKQLKEEQKISEGLRKEKTKLEQKVAKLESKLARLEDKKSVPVKYASARKALNKTRLNDLEEQIKAAPDGAQLKGNAIVYRKRKKVTEVVEFESKEDALKLIRSAKRGTVDIVG